MTIRDQNGSTIVEVVVAMLILSLLVVGLNAGVVSLIKSNLNSKELTAATAAGNQRFETFRRGDYDDIVSSTDTVRERYVRTWHITDQTSQIKIDLWVRWPKESQRHTIALSTIIAHP